MNILNGIKNFLQIVNDNWTIIVIVIGLLVALFRKIKTYISYSNEGKIEIAKAQLKEFILKLVSDAEADYSEWVQAGSIKRAQVIKEIFVEYPILSKVTNQEELVEWIDQLINEALDELRDIVDKNMIDVEE